MKISALRACAILPLQRKLIEKRQLAGQPREAVQKHEAADGQQQHTAKNFHSVQVAAKFLVKAQEAADAERGDQERNRETGGIHSQKKNSLPHRVARRGHRQNAGENWTDARRPTEGEGETHQESAGGSRLAA